MGVWPAASTWKRLRCTWPTDRIRSRAGWLSSPVSCCIRGVRAEGLSVHYGRVVFDTVSDRTVNMDPIGCELATAMERYQHAASSEVSPAHGSGPDHSRVVPCRWAKLCRGPRLQRHQPE